MLPGIYVFDNLLPGQYGLTFALPSGYYFTTANVGTDNEIVMSSMALFQT
ncbi:MAG: hypothetical protein IPO48_09155 [Saprospiraceae bacterium]|nr:hypothetical protein [Saprospiraceae bacterium]